MFKVFVLLLAADIALYAYYYHLEKAKVPFNIPDEHVNLLIQTKVLDDIDRESFDVTDYFITLGNDDQSIPKYAFEEDGISFKDDGFKSGDYLFAASFKASEKPNEQVNLLPETIAKETRKEEPYVDNTSDPVADEKPIESYFEGYHDITIDSSSTINDLITMMTRDIKTDLQYALTYAEVNLTVPGLYQAYYLVEGKTYAIKVEVI